MFLTKEVTFWFDISIKNETKNSLFGISLSIKKDNIASGKYKTNFDLGLNANKKFEEEIEKYSYNWRSGGQYTRKSNQEIT